MTETHGRVTENESQGKAVLSTSFRVERELWKRVQKLCIDRDVSQQTALDEALRWWVENGGEPVRVPVKAGKHRTEVEVPVDMLPLLRWFVQSFAHPPSAEAASLKAYLKDLAAKWEREGEREES